MALPFLNTYADFPYRTLFNPIITQEEYEEAYDIVSAMWAGVMSMWGACDPDTRQRKRQTVMALLIAWYLCDMYPTRMKTGNSDGGRPLASKSAQQISVTFKNIDLPPEYSALQSNQYGIKAALLIHSAPDMMGIYGVG